MIEVSNKGIRFRHILAINYIVLLALSVNLFLAVNNPIEVPALMSNATEDHFIKKVLESQAPQRVAFKDFTDQVAGKSLFSLVIQPKTVEVPQVDVVPKEAPVEPISVNFVLVGVVQDEDGAEAIFENKEKSKTTYVRIGETFDGFTLKKINEETVLLEKNNQSIELNKSGEKYEPKVDKK